MTGTRRGARPLPPCSHYSPSRPPSPGFNAISLRLKEMYQMITLGGDAELELVDTLDPFSEVCVRMR